MSIRRRVYHEQNGQSATEFAIVLPVFCLVLFAVIQFGILFNNYLTLTDAVRAGARTAAVSGSETNPVADHEGSRALAAGDLKDAEQSGCARRRRHGDGGWAHGDDVTVEAKYPYSINLLGFVAANGFLKSKTTERVE